MEIKIKNKNLLDLLEIGRCVVESRNTLPASAMALFSPCDKGLSMTVMNPEMEMRISLDTEGFEVNDPAPSLISVAKLYEITRNDDRDGLISINFSDNHISVLSGSSRFKLLTMEAESFPSSTAERPEKTVSVRQDDLKSVIDMTEFSMANNDARYYLNGVLMEIEESSLTAVATDGHRLAKSFLPIEKAGGEKHQAIVPRKAVSALQQILGRSDNIVEIGVTSSNFFADFDNISITATAINGQFPDYRRVIPSSFEQEIELNREETMRSLRKAAAITDGKPGGATLDFSAELLKLQVTNTEDEEARIEQKIEYQGEPFKIGFNVAYLSDVFQHLHSETVILQIRDNSSGVRIVGADSDSEEYVVMPLRL